MKITRAQLKQIIKEELEEMTSNSSSKQHASLEQEELSLENIDPEQLDAAALKKVGPPPPAIAETINEAFMDSLKKVFKKDPQLDVYKKIQGPHGAIHGTERGVAKSEVKEWVMQYMSAAVSVGAPLFMIVGLLLEKYGVDPSVVMAAATAAGLGSTGTIGALIDKVGEKKQKQPKKTVPAPVDMGELKESFGRYLKNKTVKS